MNLHRTLLSTAGTLLSLLCVASAGPISNDEDPLREARAELELMIRRGEATQALEELDEIVEEEPGDVLSRALRARGLRELCRYAEALDDARAAHDAASTEEAADLEPADRATCARTLAEILTLLGKGEEAVAILDAPDSPVRAETDPRDAWVFGRALLETGERERAYELFRQAARDGRAESWDELLARARCERVLGRIQKASETLVAADRRARATDGIEPDVLVELGSVYFEAYGEVDNPLANQRSPAELYRKALTVHPAHEGANLGLFQLHRFNWMRQRQKPTEFLMAILDEDRCPDSIPGLLADASSALDDGRLIRARRALERLEELAPTRRDVRTERAALLWIEHRRDESQALLEALNETDPGDGRPRREVGRHLLELYRFAEALPFLERSVEQDPSDWRAWTLLGRARANTGNESSALAALATAKETAGGRLDAWRDNMALVLARMESELVEHEGDGLTFTWLPDAAEILERYWEPFYSEAREELAARYGFTPEPVRVEVFRRWKDFSVRSTGYEGFPALGVCFGPVVTAVSPLSELRGSFSWARTSFHEFTHVIHLGLSHNRCPRWITEGLATWEEGTRNPAWWRNMRRDLLDARANGQIMPLRELNAAFRGPRVIFAYYQSGLICQMLIDELGFAPMVRLLDAFDRGRDLDQAFAEVFERTPEEIDAAFAEFVEGFLAGVRLEPRWDSTTTFQLRFSLSRRPPEEEAERAAWAEDWCTVAWGFYWKGQRLDAEESLRLAESSGELPPRGWFLRAELLLADRDRDGALAAYRRGFAAGGEDFRARMALGQLELEAGEHEAARAHLEAAERDFPGYAEPAFAAELTLARLHETQGDLAAAMDARMRWLAYNAGDYDTRVEVASWLDENGRHAESIRLWREATEIDPFRRRLHLQWGQALFALGRHEEALREFEVGRLVPRELEGDLPADTPELDLDRLENIDPAQRELLEAQLGQAQEDVEQAVARWEAMEPELLGWSARTLVELGRPDEARELARAALDLDEGTGPALEALEALGESAAPGEPDPPGDEAEPDAGEGGA